MTDIWDEHALWWDENFTDGVDPEYADQIIPMIVASLERGSSLLDVGCGEGQVARRAAEELGCPVVGVDTATAQLRGARRKGGSPSYVQGSATNLCAADSSFDAVVSCLVMEHVADLELSLAEVSRVLRPGGRFLMLLNHPLIQTPGSGWVDDHTVDPPEQYWQLGPYLPESENHEQVDKDVWVTFHHRPLSRYVNSAVERGLVLSRMDEPAPPEAFVAQAPEYAHQRSMPRLLFLHFTKV